MEQHERLVVRWNQDAMTKPFIGFRAERVRGNRTSRSRSVAELTNHPRVIAQEPDDIKILLFGDAVEREDRRGLGAPFGFEDDQVVEYGPYIELERP